jgi:lipopolysaccharide/colanic/teichoic acid biosynthesis glycosyltransferase
MSGAKRGLDLLGATVALVVLSPVLLAVVVVVRVVQGSPVLHRAQRAGRGERPFILHKVRTMTDARDADGSLLPDAERLTRVGRFLRSTSLDELPQLWDVLRGEMSLVGPRPLPMAYLPRYTAEERRRHEVRPGITGWAQVHGRNELSWDDKLAFDVWYVDHRSLVLDLRILARTVGQVVRRRGISAVGEATVGELRPELATAEDVRAT